MLPKDLFSASRRLGGLSLLIAYCLSLTASAQQRDFTRWVNPFIGTGGHGHTFPGATLPFGMVQLSPDTRIDNWDGSSGYHYSDDVIYGFSHTHLSGTGIPDGCDILFMPTVDERRTFTSKKLAKYDSSRFASDFSHTNERAEPGYYSVKINDAKLLVELTATTRVGFHRYTFPKSEDAGINVDLMWRDRALKTKLTPVSDRRIEGFRQSTSWAKNQTVYFVAEFSQPFVQSGDGRQAEGSIDPDIGDEYFFFPFSTEEGEQILIKVAISFVSIEGARKNLETELPHWDFDRVRAEAKAAWNRELSKIEVSGGTDAQTTNFYTALYHTMIHPNVFNDVDGRYKGHDGKIHSLGRGDVSSTNSPRRRVSPSPRRESSPRRRVTPSPRRDEDHYTVFSLWDTFRAAHPLYTIIDQRRTVDFINTFIRIYEQGGRLPVWELWGEETDTMIGYHSVSVIADAIAKNIKGFDYEKAYAAAKHSAELDHFGLSHYKKRGFISSEDENESVSKTLEYAYNDWCIATMGATLYNQRQFQRGGPAAKDAAFLKQLEADIEYYYHRAKSFENLFDTETRFFRPRRNGGFIKPFAPQEVTFHFTEANAWQYAFFVPHDVSELMHLMGGTKNFVERLDELFATEQKLSGREQPDITGLIGQYAHGNEPSHHVAYLYNYAAAPSKTQKRVRQIMDEFYKPTPDGLIGNEDCGQMSAWYVLSASGFYSVLPGDARYDLGTPIFKKVVFRLENGKTFVIAAPKASASNIYINSARWNGAPHEASYITQHHIMAGGVLDLDMSDKPNDRAFAGVSSSTISRPFVPVPVIDSDSRVFASSMKVAVRTSIRNGQIRYTLDGSEPNESSPVYTAPFTITGTTTVKARVIAGETRSSVTEATFYKRATDWTVKLLSSYSSQYTGGGDDAIVDGLRGTSNFASGEWQGYQGKTFEAVIDLQRETEIRSVGGGFLQVARSWIWIPDRVEFEVSRDGTKFTRVADIRPNAPQQEMNPFIREVTENIAPTRARYVRVRAHNFGKIPAWHLGAGGDPWIFVDEIFVR